MEDLPKQAVKEQQKDETALVLGTLLKDCLLYTSDAADD